MRDDSSDDKERVLVLGAGRLVDVARRALDDAGAEVVHLREPPDRDIRREVCAGVDAVLVISRDDRVSLRLALVVEGLRPGVRLIVTIYNRDLAAQLHRAVPSARVVSMADVAAPSLAAACLAGDLVSVRREGDRVLGVRDGADGPVAAPLAVHRPDAGDRLAANLGALLHPFELSAKTLLAGLLGFLIVLVADATVVGLVLHESAVDAIYLAMKTIVTVGPNSGVDDGPAWLKIFSATMMLAALAFTAVFTAGLIDRLLNRRLVAIFGRRTMPRSGHVVVVGLGQVGLRLCMMLRELGVPVVAVEHNPEADNIRRAKQYGIPVVMGRGNSRAVLQRLRLGRARGLAAVTSDEIENISTAMAALAVREDLRTVLRAGSGDVMDETRALLRIGAVRDVYRIGGTLFAAAALGSSAQEAFVADDAVWVIGQDGRIEPFGAHVETVRGAGSTASGPE
ncbi:MAG: NAD-binding protein [Actinomycetota bacterium]|nr:NAD-binding protein [Actinomycetota bacterium]